MLLEDEADVLGIHLWTLPVVEIVLKVSVTNPELQFLQKFAEKEKKNHPLHPSDGRY